LADHQKGETRDRVAERVGLVRTSLNKAEAVVKAAEDDPALP
jgi:hypothetical protein